MDRDCPNLREPMIKRNCVVWRKERDTNMKLPYIITFLLVTTFTKASGQSISSVDIARIDANFEKEAMFYYKHNWKEFRKAALSDGHISGFHLLRTPLDSTNHFIIVLVTEYPDSARFNAREDNFRPIMKSVSPGGPRLLNDHKPQSFIEYLYGIDGTSVFRSDGR